MNNNGLYLKKSELMFENNTSTLFQKDTIIFPKRGASIFTNKIAILKNDSMIDTNLMSMEIKTGIPLYLYYFLKNFGLYKIADTSSIPQINNIHFEGFEYPDLNLSKQQKISSLLSQIDNLISNQNNYISFIKSMNYLYKKDYFLNRINPSNSIKYSFSEVFNKVKTNKKIAKKDYLDYGILPIVSQEKEYINGYSNTEVHKFNENVILLGDHTLVLKYVPFKFQCGGDGTILLNANIDLYFAYLLLQSKLPQTEGYKRYFNIVNQISFYVPNDKSYIKNVSEFLSQMDNYTYKSLYNVVTLFLYTKVKIYLLILHIIC